MMQQIPWNWPLLEQGQIPQKLAQIATDFDPPWAAFLSQMAASPLPYVDSE
jgi:hypothetical protein